MGTRILRSLWFGKSRAPSLSREGAYGPMSEKAPMAFVSGLEDVVAAEPHSSSVDGEAGALIVAGFSVEEFASLASFEETVYLLWHDALPNPKQLAAFKEEFSIRRLLPRPMLDLLRAAASEKAPAMDALRMAAGSLSLNTSDDAAAEDELYGDA